MRQHTDESVRQESSEEDGGPGLERQEEAARAEFLLRGLLGGVKGLLRGLQLAVGKPELALGLVLLPLGQRADNMAGDHPVVQLLEQGSR